MIEQQQRVTLEQFRQLVEQPGYSDRVFELINGEIVEKMPGRTSNSTIVMILAGLVFAFCEPRQLPCVMTGEQGTYEILGRALAPDFAYKRTPPTGTYPDPILPLWVVEVISPNDQPKVIRNKREAYLQAGILYFELWPDEQSIDVYTPGEQHWRAYHVGDVIDLDAIIPGFSLDVSRLFRDAGE